jgi:hypothetical protein
MTVTFDHPAAREMWDAYFAEVDQLLAPLGPDGRELRSDLEMHLRDSLANGDSGGDEADRMAHALDRLGRPIEYLRPLLAESYLDRASSTYNPVTIGKGLFHTLLSGSGKVLAGAGFALGYLTLAIFVAIALSKPFWPDNVGVFRFPDGEIAVGIVSDTAGAQELIGGWAIPIALGLAALTYILLTKALRRLLR